MTGEERESPIWPRLPDPCPTWVLQPVRPTRAGAIRLELTPKHDPKKVQTVWLLETTRQASITIFGAALPARPAIWSRTRAAMSR